MDYGSGLLSLGSQNSPSFSSNGAAWNGAIALAEPNASSANVSASHATFLEGKESMSGLKEHDYIGLAEVSSSVKSLAEVRREDESSLSEAELDLGLGLGLGSASVKKAEECEITPACVLKQKDGVVKAPKEGISNGSMEGGRCSFPEGAAILQKPWQNTGPPRPITAEALNSASLTTGRDYESPNKVPMYSQDLGEGPLRGNGSSFYGGHMKNGTKRGYTEAMNDAARFSVTGGARVGVSLVGKSGEGELKALPQHSQGTFMSNWVPPKPSVPAHWPVGLEQSTARSFASSKPGADKPVADRTLAESSKEASTSEPPPPKGPAVGWPPIRSYRRHNLAKPAEMYVKVNMDGMTVGRKVDLNAHSSYEGLLLALDEMFQPSSNGGQGTTHSPSGKESQTTDVKQFRLLNGSDYVLTYEDQDGDWMLVGDVPWSMFVTMVRRLRIMRGSEATGLAPRRPDKAK